MAHEGLEPGRAVVYHLPTLFSDSLRSLQFSQFFSAYRGAPFDVRTADGWSWTAPAAGEPEFTARFRTRADLDAVIGDASEAALGRIFLNGGLEIQGNIFALLGVAEYTLLHSEGFSNSLVQTLLRISSEVSRRLHRVRGAATPQSWLNAPCPLDPPACFFEPWLGPSLVHSCGVFHEKDVDGLLDANFESAQHEALDRACSWLDLSPRDRLLDVTGEWGSLALHAAQQCHADVCGLSATRSQAESVCERIAARGIESRCQVECRDLRRNPYPPASFHKIAALGIFEQVASEDFARHLACMSKMLVPGGLLLLHRMTPARSIGAHLRSLHPGLPTEPLSKDLAIAESTGWELMGVETLQKDYAETLRIWIGRLRQSTAEPAGAFAYAHRAWLLYLVEIATSLHAEELHVHRISLKKPSRARMQVC